MLSSLEGPLIMIATLQKRQDHYANAVEKASFDGRYTATSVIVTLSMALALYNSLEMVFLIATTFRRWRGLYFWSLSLCTFGVFLYSIGMGIMYFNLSVLWLTKTLNDVGWVCMVVFQSLVLYSRLGLVLDNPKILRAMKWTILTNSILLAIAVVVLDFGTSYTSLPSFAKGYFYIEHIQLIDFTIQETIISTLYVWKAIGLLGVISKTETRKMIWQVLIMNIAIIGMDIVIIILQFKHLQLYQESVKGFVYSVKLKLEVHVLSRLVDLVHGSNTNRSMTLDVIDSNIRPDQPRVEVQQGISQPDPFSSWLATDEKSPVKQLDDFHAPEKRLSTSTARQPDVDDDILPSPQSSRYMARTSTRESDLLYAGVLRSLK